MFLHLFIAAVCFQGISSQQESDQPSCVGSSCYPDTGDLLIGREDRLKASSTCGKDKRERFCIVSHLNERKKCFHCDYRSLLESHSIQNIVRTFGERKPETWWQAENGKDSVSILLNLEAEFHFTHLVMRFKTFRPSAMLVERSYDFGETWKVYRYFAYDCRRSFPGVPRAPVKDIRDVICEERYSDVAPSTQGEVIFRVLPPSIKVDDPYSPEVQDLLKLTNLRVNFTKLHTLGDVLLSNRPEILEKYYYSMYEMVVRGSCSCYGHASRCVPVEGRPNNPNMVHGKCECTHNTKGYNCEQCEDFYNDLPWRPAVLSQTNACRKCNCNDHASRCHFDAAVFAASGNISGGVCDDCQHNTMGRNCEECQPFFYKDSNRDIRDPYICRPCDCDLIGSENGGECEQETDLEGGYEAGRCICKRFVGGPRCDTCLDGYWNLMPDNFDGCEACSCHTLGTVGNYGCDKFSGICTCKRFVEGRNCDQCMAQYWGLSEDPEGCKACDCDIGGSYDNDCDQVTGQCNCKLNIIGRRCDQSRPGYFVTYLDYLTYEAEYAHGFGNTQPIIREPIAGRPTTWTGPGFMKVTEGDTLEFTIDNVPYGMDYSIIIRYEPQMPDRWDDVQVTVVRPGSVDQHGPCANAIPQDDFKATSLPAGNRYYLVTPASCLEKGVSYTIKLEFKRYRSDRETPDAMMLVDSIVLVPVATSLPILKPGGNVPGSIIAEFNSFRCEEIMMGVYRTEELPDICRQLIFSIGATIFEQALDCDCDPTGSVSTECLGLGGQCRCKSNVIGRRCDQCAPGTYGFGPQGCSPCNCDNRGSLDNFCDILSGQCICQAGIYGRQCDRCQPGYYNFPNCRQCQCNGHADECEDRTGRCRACRDNTAGDRCDGCIQGWYGDPRLGVGIPCRPCQCPGQEQSGLYHADSCSLDPRTQDVVCNCQIGYSGPRCDQCADNYYGNPLVSGGRCELCDCYGNIDVRVPGSCDSNTGECLKCLYNTVGRNCEYCQDGYYGDARIQNCQACVCNVLGTQGFDQAVCDQVTGQCPCLPNVSGLSCDSCDSNHWKLASAAGCEPCECDPFGSLNTQCNEFLGQCPCIQGRGGRTCSDCEANYWGDPNIGCFPCDCNIQGAETLQCDRRTGRCECMPGISGDKCDHCARGTTGELPYCVPCGQCFDDWDAIIQELSVQTQLLIEEASNIKLTGVTGAFIKEFEEMEEKLKEVRRIIDNFGSNKIVAPIEDNLAIIRQNLTDSQNMIRSVSQDIKLTGAAALQADTRLNLLKQRIDDLKETASILKENATHLQDQDLQGAYKEILKSQQRSQAAQDTVVDSDFDVADSQNKRRRVEDLIAANQAEFQRKYDKNEQDLGDVGTEVTGIENKIIDLNEQVCDQRGDPCDDFCGGAGCGKCGGDIGCDDGAVTKAQNALTYANDAETKLNAKQSEADNLLSNVQNALIDAEDAKADAQMAFDEIESTKNQSEEARNNLQDLIQRISDFMDTKGARPAEIRTVAEEVLAMKISLTPDQIKDLARQINEVIDGLTNIDDILTATEDDRNTALSLKDRADKARTDAEDILALITTVSNKLADAQTAQDNAQVAIDQANEDVRAAEGDLTQTESETDIAIDKAKDNLKRANDLKGSLDDLRSIYTENAVNVQRATDAATDAEDLANQAEQAANDLELNYKDVTDKLDAKSDMTAETKKRATELQKRAQELSSNTTKKLQRLKEMEVEFVTNEKTLIDLSEEIKKLLERMKEYNQDITDKSQFYIECDPTPQ